MKGRRDHGNSPEALRGSKTAAARTASSRVDDTLVDLDPICCGARERQQSALVAGAGTAEPRSRRFRCATSPAAEQLQPGIARWPTGVVRSLRRSSPNRFARTRQHDDRVLVPRRPVVPNPMRRDLVHHRAVGDGEVREDQKGVQREEPPLPIPAPRTTAPTVSPPMSDRPMSGS